MRRTALIASLLLLLPLGSRPPDARAAEPGFSTAVAAMRKGLRSGHMDDRRLAVWELDGFDSADAARTLCRLVLARDDQAPVINAALRLLGALKSDEAIDALIRESKAGSGLRRARVIEALGLVGGPRVEEALLAAAGDEDPLVRISAVLCLEREKSGRANLAISDAMKSPHWTVRSAAIDVARLRGGTAVIPDLIERLRPGAEEGRLQGDAVIALRRITEQQYGTSYESWRRWYEEVEGGELPDAPEDVTAPPPHVRVEFPGIKSVAGRVVFVLAVHESMRKELTREGEWRVPREVQAEGGAELRRWEQAETKLDLSKLWLAWSIRHLSPEVRFDVVTYGEGANAAFSGLVPATPANREKAVRRIESLSASGRANLFAGLKSLFTLISKDPLDLDSLTNGPEMVIFISDGSCEYGEIPQGYAAVDEAAAWNRYRQIRFYTVSPGAGDARVLAELAGIGPDGRMLSIP